MKKLGKKSILVLLSGGMDSTALLEDCLSLYQCVRPVYIVSGFRWEKAELFWLRRIWWHLKSKPQGQRLKSLIVQRLDMKDFVGANHWALQGKAPGRKTSDSAVYLPGRNLLLLSKAAVLASIYKIRNIALGTLAGNPFADASQTFFNAMTRAVSLALNSPIKIHAPYAQFSKADILLRHRNFPIHLTFSCIQPQGRRHCGYCNKCAERQRAFRKAGIADPTRYSSR